MTGNCMWQGIWGSEKQTCD